MLSAVNLVNLLSLKMSIFVITPIKLFEELNLIKGFYVSNCQRKNIVFLVFHLRVQKEGKYIVIREFLLVEMIKYSSKNVLNLMTVCHAN